MDSIVTSTRHADEKIYSLSAALVQRDPQKLGVLFNLRAYAGFMVRLRYRDAGFAVERILGRTVEPLRAHVRLDFLSEAATRDARHPLAPVITAIPAEALGFVGRLPEEQLHAFRVFAACPPAVDLIRSSPRLLWLLIMVSAERSAPMEEIAAVLGRRRHEVLGWCGGVPTKAAVRYLERRQIASFDRSTVRRVLEECASAAVIRDTAHVRAPDDQSACFSLLYPEFIDVEAARLSIDPDTRTASPMEIRILFRDTLQMTEEGAREEITRRLRSCGTVEGLRQIHDEVLATFLARESLVADSRGRRLPRPPLPGTLEIQPLTSAPAIQLEGLLMKHCCASYVGSVRAGRSYLYRVLAPERATLELDVTRPEPRVAQLKLACNGQPRRETFAVVEAWLAARLEERRAARQAG